MKSQLKISVLTPSYNSAKYLERAIQSVVFQNYPCWEHIVVDGASTDETLDVLKKYKHVNWVSESDRGQSDAMNKAFKLSSGNVIVYLNADDYFLPGAFSKVIELFEGKSENTFVLGNVLQENFYKKDEIQNNFNSRFSLNDLILKRKKIPLNPVCYFYSRSLQLKIGDFPINEHYVMDYWFLLRAFYIGDVYYLNYVLGVFCMTGENKTSTVNSNNAIKNKSIEFCMDHYPEKVIDVENNFNTSGKRKSKSTLKSLNKIFRKAYLKIKVKLIRLWERGNINRKFYRKYKLKTQFDIDELLDKRLSGRLEIVSELTKNSILDIQLNSKISN